MQGQRSEPVLVPLTPETRSAAGMEVVVLSHLPYRVGRESRYGVVEGRVVSIERRETDAKPNNDLYLADREEFLNISREHFQIERKADGTYELVDRGSTCGTIVDGHPVGGKGAGGRIALHHDSVIRVGTPNSPFAFRFIEQADGSGS